MDGSAEQVRLGEVLAHVASVHFVPDLVPRDAFLSNTSRITAK
jgi:hypothetical protein